MTVYSGILLMLLKSTGVSVMTPLVFPPAQDTETLAALGHVYPDVK